MTTKKPIRSYRDLIVWQRSMELTKCVYALTKTYPKEELYSLTSQTRRSAVSIPSNIAEGFYRSTRKDYRSFLYNAFGSGGELETQLEIAKSLQYGDAALHKQAEYLLREVMAMLNSMITKLKD